MMGKRLTQEEFISKAIRKHGLRYDYRKSIYTTRHSLITITCRIHGDFTQLAHNHLRGSGCIECGKISRMEIQSKEARESFIERATAIHNGKYSYESFVYVSCAIKGAIYCTEHGIFYQNPNNHLFNKGCPSCASSGFDRSKTATLYMLITDAGFIGFGITGNLKVRLRTHKRNLNSQNIRILQVITFSGSGEDVLSAELIIKHKFANSRVLVEGFKTEAFSPDRLSGVLEYLRNVNTLSETSC